MEIGVLDGGGLAGARLSDDEVPGKGVQGIYPAPCEGVTSLRFRRTSSSGPGVLRRLSGALGHSHRWRPRRGTSRRRRNAPPCAREDVSPEKGEDRSGRNGPYDAGSDPRLASPFSEEPVDQPGARNEEKDRKGKIEPISHKDLVDIGSDGAAENVPVQEEEHQEEQQGGPKS